MYTAEGGGGRGVENWNFQIQFSRVETPSARNDSRSWTCWRRLLDFSVHTNFLRQNTNKGDIAKCNGHFVYGCDYCHSVGRSGSHIPPIS
jgi:hypothetical protein